MSREGRILLIGLGVIVAPVAAFALWHLHRAGRETAWFFHGLASTPRAGGAVMVPEPEPVPPVTTPHMFVRASITWT